MKPMFMLIKVKFIKFIKNHRLKEILIDNRSLRNVFWKFSKEDKEKYFDDDDMWNEAEDKLREIFEKEMDALMDLAIYGREELGHALCLDFKTNVKQAGKTIKNRFKYDLKIIKHCKIISRTFK